MPFRSSLSTPLATAMARGGGPNRKAAADRLSDLTGFETSSFSCVRTRPQPRFLIGEFPENREFNREFCKNRPIETPVRAGPGSNSKSLQPKLPDVTEQEIFITGTGNFCPEWEIIRRRARPVEGRTAATRAGSAA